MKPLALTMGEPAGIGGEIALAAWLKGGLPPFFLIDDANRLEQLAARLGWTVPIRAIAEPEEAVGISDALAVLHRPLPAPVVPGKPDTANSLAVIAAIELAVKLVRDGRAGAVVTNPIHKESLYQAGFKFPGHTEFLAELGGIGRVVMLIASPALNVVPVTIHQSLKEAIAGLTSEDIVATGRIVDEGFRRDFGIARPRLAVAGVNPHAGEGGALGREDLDIIAPAVAALRREGIAAVGPLAADTMFHAEARATYDVALGMYHDQALIPVKTLDFHGGVNVTLGLPFIRTSPDHGTAFGLAGTGTARPDSLISALTLAAQMAARRANG
jgi:4-hydroxythreonine-4-phosphate dehydrogenase